VACMGEERKVCRVLVGRPKGRRPLRRSRHRWQNGIKMDLGGDLGGGVSGSTWLRVENGGRLL
jgi:hypothetical protein